MRAYLSVATVVVAAFLICSFVSQAQAVLPLPGCEATPEVRKIMDEKLESNLLDKMKFAERLAYQLSAGIGAFRALLEFDERVCSRGVRENPRPLGAVC